MVPFLATDVAAAVGASTGRDRPNHQRSAAAKQRRRKAAKAKHARTPGIGGEVAADVSEARNEGGGGGAGSDDGVAGDGSSREQLLRELLMARRTLKDRDEVLALTRRQLRRETKTAKARHQQLARRGSKAAKTLSRKLFAKQTRAGAGAARRENERKRKRVQPDGEALHSGQRKHQRHADNGGGRVGHGKGEGKGRSEGKDRGGGDRGDGSRGGRGRGGMSGGRAGRVHRQWP